MGIGSYLPQYNKLQILRMNGERGLTKEVEINEPWPQSKILWYPRPDESFGPGNDLIATSSDILRLYEIHESDGIYRQSREPIPFVNQSEFCQPITSFDWNQFDPRTIATASLDSSVTIWDIQEQEITTQLVAHEKAVYDISFSLDQTVFATVGEDGSVRLFDTRELRNSNIIYETEGGKIGLTHVKWNHKNPNLMAVVAEEDTNVYLFDKRRPNTIFETLPHRSKVNAIAWCPHDSGLICSVGEGGNALIWDINEEQNQPQKTDENGQVIE